MEEPKIDTTMLNALLQKKSWVMSTAEQTHKPLDRAISEVDRQIRQCLKGEKVTKSGPED